MIKDFSLKTLELAINTALKMDTQYIDKLTPLAHHSVELIVMPFQISFFMAFREDHITLSSTQNKPADTIIQSSPMGFIRLSFLPSSKARSLFNDKIRISGNTELGMAIKKLFDGLDLDWEGHIASFTGDIVAHQIGQFVQKTQDKCEGFRKSLHRNTSEYIQNECLITPTKSELEHFYHEVDTLALAAERLSAKIHLLEQKKHEKN